MRLSKGMKRETLKASLCNRCRLTISRKSYLIETTSSSPNSVKRHKTPKMRPLEAAWHTPQAITIQMWSQEVAWGPKLSFKCHQLEESQTNLEIKWIDYSTSSMNASRQSWRKNMIREWISYTRELRRSNHTKAHIKMHISYWCRIASTMLVKYHPSKAPSRSLAELVDHHQPEATNSTFLAWIEAWARKDVLSTLTYKTGTINRQTLQTEVELEKAVPTIHKRPQTVSKYRRRSNITNSTLTVPRKQLTWWESNTKQHRSWDWMSQMKDTTRPRAECLCISKTLNHNLLQMALWQTEDLTWTERTLQLYQITGNRREYWNHWRMPLLIHLELRVRAILLIHSLKVVCHLLVPIKTCLNLLEIWMGKLLWRWSGKTKTTNWIKCTPNLTQLPPFKGNTCPTPTPKLFSASTEARPCPNNPTILFLVV